MALEAGCSPDPAAQETSGSGLDLSTRWTSFRAAIALFGPQCCASLRCKNPRLACGALCARVGLTKRNHELNMKKQQKTRILSSILFLTACCATDVFGDAPTLSEIPPVAGDASNEGRAITSDGQYIVGLSGTARGFLYPVGSASSIYVLSSDNAGATIANGVGYRTALDPVYATNRTEVIISGMSSGYVTEWMTSDGGTSFGAKRRDTSFTYNNMGTVNQLGATTGSDAYYVTSENASPGTSLLYVNKGSGTWVAAMTLSSKGIASDVGFVNSVGASGRAVGWRGASKTQSAKRNYMLTWNGTGTPSPVFFNGLAGTDSGEAMSVSADGNTIFGRSRTVSDASNFYGYKVVNPGASQTINALPEFGDTGGSTSRTIPYGCTADGQYAVGLDYRGQERAVMWDTSNADPNIWTVLDLTDLARNNGFLGDFTLNLRRAYSAGTNGAGDVVVSGYGVNSSAFVRAFVMTVPKWIAAIGFPGNQTVNYGANVTINLKTNGTDSLSYQWYKDGSALSGATSTSLSYNNVTCAGGQAGTYSVVVSNPTVSGVVTGAMALTVIDPVISAQPLNRTNLEASAATFTVSADSSGGASSLSYQWQRDGSDLADGPTGNGSTIAGASTATLTISSVTLSDGTNTAGSGSYTVRVTTSAGGCSTTSRAATLMVVGVPVLSSIVPDNAGSYTLNFSGPYNQTYKVLYSTNVSLPLSSWKPLITNTFSGGADSYSDTTPADTNRFYKVVSPYTLTLP